MVVRPDAPMDQHLGTVIATCLDASTLGILIRQT